MTEKDKMLAGIIYDANNDPALIAERLECKEFRFSVFGNRNVNVHTGQYDSCGDSHVHLQLSCMQGVVFIPIWKIYHWII